MTITTIRSSGTSLNPPLDLPARVVECDLTYCPSTCRRTFVLPLRSPTLYSKSPTEAASTPIARRKYSASYASSWVLVPTEHTKTTAVRRAPRTKTPPPKNERKLQSGWHNLTRFHETAHSLLSHHVVSSHKTQHPSTHCSGFNATKASCQSPAPPHKTYTLDQVMDTKMALPSEGEAVAVAGRTSGDTRTLPL